MTTLASLEDHHIKGRSYEHKRTRNRRQIDKNMHKGGNGARLDTRRTPNASKVVVASRRTTRRAPAGERIKMARCWPLRRTPNDSYLISSCFEFKIRVVLEAPCFPNILYYIRPCISRLKHTFLTRELSSLFFHSKTRSTFSTM